MALFGTTLVLTYHGVDENVADFIAAQKSVCGSCEFQLHVFFV